MGTKKYRPPEMKDGRAAQPPIDIYCFGLMIEKLLRQRQRVSIDGCAARMPPAAPLLCKCEDIALPTDAIIPV